MSDETPVHLFAQRFAAEADKDFDRCNGLYSRVSSAKTARGLFHEAVKGDRQSRLILNDTSNTWITQRVKEDYFRLAGALLAAGYTRPEMVNLVRHALIGRGEFSTDVAIAAELYARDIQEEPRFITISSEPGVWQVQDLVTKQILPSRSDQESAERHAAKLEAANQEPEYTDDDGELTAAGEQYLANIKARRAAAENKGN